MLEALGGQCDRREGMSLTMDAALEQLPDLTDGGTLSVTELLPVVGTVVRPTSPCS